MNRIEGEFEGVNDIKLYYQAWLPEKDPKAIIIAAHGFASHSGRLINVATALIPLDFGFYANDHRGHGKSGGKQNYVKNMDEYVEDERNFYEIVKKKHSNLPIFMLGQSMGSAITFYFAQIYSQDLKGIIVSGSGTKYGGDKVPKIKIKLAKAMSKVAPKFSASTGLDPNLLSRDPEVVKAYINDPLVHYKKTTAGQANSMIESFKKLPDIVGNLECPILVQKGLADEIITGYDELKSALNPNDVTFREYEGLYHEIYNELSKDREKVLRDLSDWLENHL
ncbi:hypothetical protein LCGC14_0718010 [marine sediment metagenome]|uniref:Serine aminopeptidase S33 domain-containing protein n=1 Tax=marine sediment metagenome TaxID=412755 RepID=A0A0F9SYK7_9ZZZZ|nr:alpha/beta hydrolase [archaeon]